MSLIAVYVFLLSFGRPKHPYKFHVWAGIILRGWTGIGIFTGTMDRYLYVNILQQTLLPFIRDVFPNSHRFMTGNDPKHCFNYTKKDFVQSNSINWWRTPAESPDLIPIEYIWHELKEYLRRGVKPTTKEELVQGIVQFCSI